ncbi:MAG: toll/interleukin-1 receptor domain-containing protein [Candidatus Thiodiazotropha sp. (ex. Lucinisca nassula)]|nr:toll/interleukin-1 receptor domain-containing protein [Candidatus Thiodiazotropha sp. (ex. Lucinisca nassula)]
MANIFISYRREDSADVTGRIHDRLVEHFGESAVFMDVDDIPLGVDFTRYIDEKVGQCEVLLAVIGRDWLNATDEEGDRRLEQSGDYVRIELESALKRKIPVVPLLVRRASMPEADELPESIRDFAKRNGMQVRADPDFRTDCDRLIEGLERDRTGKRPIISTRNKRVAKKPRGKHKALIIGVLGIAVVSTLIGLFTWYASRPGPAPSIVEFQADPNRVEQGSTTTLRWMTKNTEKVSIQPNIGTVAVSGSKVIRPRENTTYTLVATGSDNRHAKQRLSIQVNSQTVATIPLSRLSVAENTIELGKSTTLSWRTRDATDVEIKPGIGSVEANGSIEISPRRNTTYTLTAKSPAGTATSNILVRVERTVPRTIITRPAIR